MFDRLYKLEFHHTAFGRKTFGIVGDSSKPSLNISFSCTVNQVATSYNARLTVYGLKEDTINKLAAIRRYKISKNASENNTATLSVGWRDLDTGAVSKMTVICHGVIMEAIPGPLPERSISMSLMCGMTKDAEIAKKDAALNSTFKEVEQVPETANGIPMKKWLETAAKTLNDGGNALQDAEQNYRINIKGNYDEWKTPAFLLPRTFKAFGEFVNNCGLVFNQQVLGASSVFDKNSDLAGDGKKPVAEIMTVQDKMPTPPKAPFVIAQKTGMIGIPRSTTMGAVVDVVLNSIINPGMIVDLQSAKFTALNSNAKDYSEGGLYRVLSATYIGNFYGEQWLQRLELCRGATALK